MPIFLRRQLSSQGSSRWESSLGQLPIWGWHGGTKGAVHAEDGAIEFNSRAVFVLFLGAVRHPQQTMDPQGQGPCLGSKILFGLKSRVGWSRLPFGSIGNVLGGMEGKNECDEYRVFRGDKEALNRGAHFREESRGCPRGSP